LSRIRKEEGTRNRESIFLLFACAVAGRCCCLLLNFRLINCRNVSRSVAFGLRYQLGLFASAKTEIIIIGKCGLLFLETLWRAIRKMSGANSAAISFSSLTEGRDYIVERDKKKNFKTFFLSFFFLLVK